MLYGLESGELDKWLRVIAENEAAGRTRTPVPQKFVDMLVSLRVVRPDSLGLLRVTEKGRLSMRMAAPDALHKQEDPDAAKRKDDGVEDVDGPQGSDDR
ncbi:MAG: hypothetical protein ABW210_08610 [Achromobacter sp.]|jgi:hypothetical protein